MNDFLFVIILFYFAFFSVYVLAYSLIQLFKDKKKESILVPKIKKGSKVTIGKVKYTFNSIILDQHFNWFQKKMWWFLLGIKIEDYSEED